MITIEVVGDKAVQSALSVAPKTLLKSMGKGIHRAAQEVTTAEKKASPKAFSHLVNSIRADRIDALHYSVSVGVNYAEGIEFGTKPGVFPPIESIQEWLRIKRIEPQDDGTSRRDLAFMIARGIFKYGIQAKPFFYPTVEKMTPRVHELVREALNIGMDEAFT